MDADLQALCDAKDGEMYKLQAEIERLREEKDKAYDNGFIVGTQKSPSYKENQELRDENERLRELLREALDPYARASIDWRVGWTNRVREALEE